MLRKKPGNVALGGRDCRALSGECFHFSQSSCRRSQSRERLTSGRAGRYPKGRDGFNRKDDRRHADPRPQPQTQVRIDACIMHLPANDVAAKLIGWMREHPDKDWIDSLDTALTALGLCGK